MAQKLHHIALFRAINVGGSNVVTMVALRDFAELLEFTNVQTLLQTGNLIFKGNDHTDGMDSLALEQHLEHEATNKLNISTSIMLRNKSDWQRIIANNPFKDEAVNDPSHLVVMFLKSAPHAAAVEALRAAIVGRETLHCEGKDLYVCYHDGIGRSKLTNKIIEKKLDVQGTARNWNTILKVMKAMT